DFRGFGALILNELEATAERLLALRAGGADEKKLSAAFDAEMLTLGNSSLDPFAGSLREVRKLLERRFPNAPLRFYFGGDDVTVLMPRGALFPDGSREPSRELLNEVFDEIPGGMRARVVIASNAPYRGREPRLAVSLALTAADELAGDAKRAEDGWVIGGRKVEEVVSYADANGGRWRMPVFGRRVGDPSLEHPGHEDSLTYVAKEMMGYYKRFVNRSANDEEARHWAESKLEESIILLGAVVSLLELPLLPGISLLITNLVGPTAAILAGAMVMVLFHELTLVVSAIRQGIRRLRGLPLRRQPPPGPWYEHFLVRTTVRFVVATAILWIAFIPLYTFMAPDLVISFERIMPFVPTTLTAFLLHAVWNAFAPPAWRLSLVRYPPGGAGIANQNYPDEIQDTPLAVDVPGHAIRVRGVFDGYGGRVVGATASRNAAAAAGRSAAADIARFPPAGTTLFGDANILIRAMRQAEWNLGVKPKEAATTASVATIDGRRITVAQAGDSGAYLFLRYKDGRQELRRITFDNLDLSRLPPSVVISNAGGPIAAIIDRDQPLPPELNAAAALQRMLGSLDTVAGKTLAEVEAFWKRNAVNNTITGSDRYFPVLYTTMVPPDAEAMLVLVSDGVADNLTDDEIMFEIASSRTPREASERLVRKSAERMRMVDAARPDLRTLVRFYDDMLSMPPGKLGGADRPDLDAFLAPGRPKLRLGGSTLISFQTHLEQDLNAVWPNVMGRKTRNALVRLGKIVAERFFVRAKTDDTLAVSEKIERETATTASLFDRSLERKLLGTRWDWFYRLYTVVLVNWELAFFA
ncbi:MAG: protein phosphatase 2C family protein, partial [Elusimicrobia bacterium]|nr:protein phosphatase 2C family protein [Elusimicrobiota bacterium]